MSSTRTAHSLHRLVALVCAIVLAIVAASCGDDSSTTASAEAPRTTGGSNDTAAAPVERVTLKVGKPVGSVQAVYQAIENGYFDEEGIDIEFENLAGGPVILAALEGGSIDIGFADTYAWIDALKNGFDLRLIQSANGAGNTDHIIVGPGSGIEKPADLAGKKIGIAAYTQAKVRVHRFLEEFGVDPDSVEWITIQQRDTIGAALANGTIDAALSQDPSVAVWENEFEVRSIGNPWKYLTNEATMAGYFVTGRFADERPDVIERFVRAYRRGAAAYNEASARDKAELQLRSDNIDVFQYEDVSPGIVERLNDPNAAHTGAIDLDETTKWIDLAVGYGLVPGGVDFESHIHPTALDS